MCIGGIINAFYTRTHCSGSQNVGGLALASQALGCGGVDGRTVIGNGLLPNALITSAKSRQEGYDVGATLMIGAATASESAIGNNSNVDVRQGFLTVGDADMGTFKLGRHYGLFGQAATTSATAGRCAAHSGPSSRQGAQGDAEGMGQDELPEAAKLRHADALATLAADFPSPS